MTNAAWSQPRHDGSVLYVPEPNPRLGGKVRVFLRLPRTSDNESAWACVIYDGKPELVLAMVDPCDERDTRLRTERVYSYVI